MKVGDVIQIAGNIELGKIEYIGLNKVEARLIPSGVLINATGKIRRLIREVCYGRTVKNGM